MTRSTTLVFLHHGLFSEKSGGGIYLESLLPSLLGSNNLNKHLVRTDDVHAKYTYNTIVDGCHILHIPRPDNGLVLTGEDTEMQRIYARRMAEIIVPHLSEADEGHTIIITHLGHYIALCEELRQMIDCKVIYVHTAWSWKSVLGISDDAFKQRYFSPEIKFREAHKLLVELTSFQRKMAESSDFVVTTSRQALQFFEEVFDFPIERMRHIYPGVAPAFYAQTNRDALRNELGIDQRTRIVIFSGELDDDAGLGVLISAFKLLQNVDRQIKLVVIGKGDFGKFLTMLDPIWSRVIFTGPLSEENLRKWYSISDVGIVPNMHEQCGITALQMSSYGIPLIVSPAEVLDEIYTHDVDCLKLEFAYNDFGIRQLSGRQLANFIEELLTNDELSNRLGTNARKNCDDLYNLKVLGREYLKVFDDVVQCAIAAY